ncbi:MAG: ribosome biogenesis GTPase Der [Planctomycetes bacterium]|nr:ribosome biogenesis GTPase Der [Planctomycetota bacterium]
MSLPVIAIVGRPNVGKSSLLNSLARRMISIVEPTPGVTRDRVSTLCEVNGTHFELVDTGGYGIEDHDDLTEHVERQISFAIDRSTRILFVVDVMTGILPLDLEVAKLLRPFHDRVMLVANKADDTAKELQASEFMRLGFGEPIIVSALHNRGRQDLLETLAEAVGQSDEVPLDPVMKVAVIGRQNTGKSTFINSLAGEEHVIVSEVPGTTRDAVDLRFEIEGRAFVAIDTAGVKKRSRWAGSIEFYGYTRVVKSISRADVCVLFIDSTKDITSVDKKLARIVADEMKPCVLVVNKWDLVNDRASTDDYSAYLTKTVPEIDYAPVVFTSAKDSHNTDAVIDTAWSLFKQSRTRVSTGQLNRALADALSGRGPSPKRGSKVPRIYYATQVSILPPTLVLFVNHPSLIRNTYKRYLLNCLQAHLPFQEVPIRVLFRARRGRDTPDISRGSWEKDVKAGGLPEDGRGGHGDSIDQPT